MEKKNEKRKKKKRKERGGRKEEEKKEEGDKKTDPWKDRVKQEVLLLERSKKEISRKG